MESEGPACDNKNKTRTLMSRQRCHSGGSGAASKLSSIPSTTSPRSSSLPSRFRFLLVAAAVPVEEATTLPTRESHGGRLVASGRTAEDCSDTIDRAATACYCLYMILHVRVRSALGMLAAAD